MKLPYEEFDLSSVKTYPLRSRTSKVTLAQFATPYQAGSGLGGFVKSLPGLLAAKDFKDVVQAIVAAKRGDRAIVWGLGAHVLKTGLSPVLVDLMERGFVSAIAMNGAGIIHDFEIALSGGTSEDVDATLGPGTFGMAEETGTQLNRAIATAFRKTSGRINAEPQFRYTPPSSRDTVDTKNLKSRRLASPIAAPEACGCMWMMSVPTAT